MGEVSKTTFLLFHFIGYNSRIDDETLTDRVDIKLIGEEYDEVLTRAKKIVVRNSWFLAEVTEFISKEC